MLRFLFWIPILAISSALAQPVAIVGANAVQLDSSGPILDAVVLIDGERISRIGTASDTPIPQGARVIQLKDAWLLPGLMNMHVHFGLKLPGAEGARLANESDAALALRMASNARQTLYAGVTTVRQPGDARHADIALRDSINRGESEGPRIHSAGEMVDITAGHGASGETHDGPYALRRAVRSEIGAGATWIKIAISGGIATRRGGIAASLMTPDEVEAVIDAAHRLDAKVTAHSGSPQATAQAVRAGIDCIEHGYLLTREVLQQMKAAGTWYVPTIVVSQPSIFPFFERIGSPPWFLERVRSVGKQHWQALEMAIEEGVQIALGTDQMPHEPNDGTTATVREAEYYVEAGMTPLQALRSATVEAARLLGVEDQAGDLKPGLYADIVAVESNPLEDISALRSLFFVMKGGKVVRAKTPRREDQN